MNAENLRGDDCSDRETVENVDESFPNLDVAPSFALVIESIHCRVTDSKSAAQARGKTESEERETHPE